MDKKDKRHFVELLEKIGPPTFIGGKEIYERETMLKRGLTRIIVTTIGSVEEIYKTSNEIGLVVNKYWGTLAHHATMQKTKWAKDMSRPVLFEASMASVNETGDTAVADLQHDTVVKELFDRIMAGEFSIQDN